MERKIKNAGFTLVEVIIAVTLVGVSAVIGINYYGKTVERARARDALINLTAIHSKNQILNIKSDSYWPTGADLDVEQINAVLELEIVEDGVEYLCSGTGATFTCTAERTPARTFTVNVTEAPIDNTNPLCQGDACPN